ncbi:Fructose-1,6-bisphosphatase class 1 [Sinobacterium norvegicum]|uniref:Fructose-1,6-bisphosphatase class 1 n=1 Tax=Sinobacterium norvegicum TaxID=1641715 RepID=A0ABM9AJQ8_9GAMM|nr:class 1 fructose-bisphosphatase [Sinobacterium norvegicum]CAH0993300.1 Fructose-1,6-bisphosphatase class 1 [Sinobacterium norvegicum]
MQTFSASLRDAGISAELANTLNALAIAGKDINFRLQQGSIGGVLGSAGNENVQGETQKKLDVISNDLLKEILLGCGSVRAIASEEEDSYVAGPDSGQYLVNFDPLDGSSNIDINAMVGTIFSIYPFNGGELSEQSFLQKGRDQVAAGYILYGPSTMLVLSTGNGVQMYTLDPAIGEFVLTVEQVSIDADTKEFAINMSNQRFWAEPMQQYITDLLQGSEGPRGKNFNMRWVAAMVGDVHRVLCRGGLFTYPWDNREPGKAGKLRLMYEANPMSLLIEQAGGESWTDKERILDIQPTAIHQRVPVILGSASEVKNCLKYHGIDG